MLGQIKRFIQLGKQLATEDFVLDESFFELCQKFDILKGPFLKIAQFLSVIPGVIPEEISDKIIYLQSNATPMSQIFVRRRLKVELGADWEKYFDSFDLQSFAAASLGQVHKATLHDGTKIACKLQYPAMAEKLEADFKTLDILTRYYQRKGHGLLLNDAIIEIKERLREEIDYYHEARQIKLFQNIFKNYQNIHIPKTHDDLIRPGFLPMSYVNGKKIYSFFDSSKAIQQKIARSLFWSWYYPFCCHGVIHGDAHPGNYLIDKNHHIHLLDFGCVKHFSDEFVDGIIMLHRALLSNHKTDLLHAYELLGFKDLSKEKIALITGWAKMVYDPLLDDRVRTIQVDCSGKSQFMSLKMLHKELKQTGGLMIPREIVFLDRACVTLGSILMRMEVQLNWYEIFNNILMLRENKKRLSSG